MLLLGRECFPVPQVTVSLVLGREELLGGLGGIPSVLTIPAEILNSWKLLMFSFAAFLQLDMRIQRFECLILFKLMK